MSETISIHLTDFIGSTTLNLFLRRTDNGVLVNTGGDSLSELPASSGRFIATLAESRAGLGTLAVIVCDGAESAANLVWGGWLAEATTLCVDNFPQSSGGGGGGVTDWTSTERSQIRYRLGIDGTATAPTAPVAPTIVVTPGSAGKTTGYVTCLNSAAAAVAGVSVFAALARGPAAGIGFGYSTPVRAFTTDANGLAQLTNLIKGCAYYVSAGTQANPQFVEIPSDAGDTLALPSLLIGS